MTASSSLPTITIVTPSYNQEIFLEQTINSVLGQNYPNLEYIIVDGGSTDGSPEIIRKYEKSLAWWISEKDNGQAEGINKGLKRANGEIIAWLNSDDLYQPGAFFEVAKFFYENPDCGLVYGDVLAIDGTGKLLNILRAQPYSLSDLLEFKIINQPAVFFRRSTLQAAGYLDLNYHFLLDHHLWIRMAATSPIQYVNHTWAAARFHEQAKNISQAVRFSDEAAEIVRWMKQNPGLADQFRQRERRIYAGMYRLSGYYLSEGKKTVPALSAYLKSFSYSPSTALADWKRILYTLIRPFRLSWLHPLYQRIRGKALEREL